MLPSIKQVIMRRDELTAAEADELIEDAPDCSASVVDPPQLTVGATAYAVGTPGTP